MNDVAGIRVLGRPVAVRPVNCHARLRGHVCARRLVNELGLRTNIIGSPTPCMCTGVHVRSQDMKNEPNKKEKSST